MAFTVSDFNKVLKILVGPEIKKPDSDRLNPGKTIAINNELLQNLCMELINPDPF